VDAGVGAASGAYRQCKAARHTTPRHADEVKTSTCQPQPICIGAVVGGDVLFAFFNWESKSHT
ncbi:unnamed protein product, partial [Ceratitis capitata]